ncbi:hypothetical protein [Nocardia sp. NPDC004711]
MGIDESSEHGYLWTDKFVQVGRSVMAPRGNCDLQTGFENIGCRSN